MYACIRKVVADSSSWCALLTIGNAFLATHPLCYMKGRSLVSETPVRRGLLATLLLAAL